MRRLGLFVVLAAVLVSRGALAADPHEAAWTRGNEAYLKGDYQAAVAAYQQIDRDGIVSADLCYNLGVAHFRLGNLGRAVWAFERALALEPDDEDARFNLQQARKLLARRAEDKIEGAEREPTWIRLVTLLPTSAATWLFVIVYCAAFALLFVRRRAAEDARAPLSAAAALAFGAAALAGVLLLGHVVLDRIPFGIILPDVVSVKEGADLNYRTSFELHAGLKVRLLEQDGEWMRVRLANGLEGWVREQDVGRL